MASPGHRRVRTVRASTDFRCQVAMAFFEGGKPALTSWWLLCRLRVVRDRRAGADQVAVAIDVVDAANRGPIFIRARNAVREAALGAAVGAFPVVIGDVMHGVRRMPQR